MKTKAARVRPEQPRMPGTKSTKLTSLSQSKRSTTSANDPLMVYFRQMTKFPLLTAKEELSLAKELEAVEVEMWRRVVASPSSHPLLRNHFEAEAAEGVSWRKLTTFGTEPKIQALLAKELRKADPDQLAIQSWLAYIRKVKVPNAPLTYQAGILECFNKATAIRGHFIKSNLRLVIRMCRPHLNRGIDMIDLVQEGNIGLMRGVGRFDHRRKFRFSTYSTWWIRHSLGRLIQDQAKTIRVPVHMHEVVAKANKAKYHLTRELGRFPTDEEVASVTGLSLKQIRNVERYQVSLVSLDAESSDDDNRTLADSLPNPDAIGVEEQAISVELFKQVQKYFKFLKPIEVDVLRQRFGLDGEEKTFKEIGDKYKLSRERIRQLEVSALSKLRDYMAGSA